MILESSMEETDKIIDFRHRVDQAWALLHAAPISDQNKTDIRRFVEFKLAQRVSLARQDKYLRTLRLLAVRFLEEGEDFRGLTKEEVISIVARIEQSDLKQWTKFDYEYFLKIFLSWLGKEETVTWINVRTPKRMPDDVLSYEDVQKMIDCAHNPRDRALIAMLFERGTRIAEIGNLSRGDLKFEQFCVAAMVNGKTGHYPVYFVWAMPYISRWLEAHPLHEDAAPLWVQLQGEPKMMKYEALRLQLIRIAKRAGIKKRVNPHNFRHTRLTLYSKEKELSEAMIKQLMGLSPNSRVLDVYRHLTGTDARDAVLKMHGIQTTDTKEEKYKIRQCPFCHAVNTDTAVTCISCHRPLSVTQLVTREEQIRGLFEDLLHLSLVDPDVADAVKRYFERKSSNAL